MENNKEILVHHGIKGQRWGVRRFQNEDGSLTNAGKSRQKKELTPEQKEKRKKIAKGVAIGAGTTAVAAGAAYLTARGIFAKTAGDFTASLHNAKISSQQSEIMRRATYWDGDTGIIGAINRHSKDYKAYKNIAQAKISRLESQKTTAGKEFAKLFFDHNFKIFS